MKAQRRHDLKTNTLARGLENLPEAGRQHGTKILVAVLAVLLVVFLVRQWLTSSREKAVAAAYSLNNARASIGQLDDALDMGFMSPQIIADLRQQVARVADEAVRQVLETADDPALLAEARLTRGDLNWKLANFPDLPGSSTQPALQYPRSREELLKTAAEAYSEVIDDPAAPQESKWTARFGLAAVHENRREWDKAKEQYQKLVNDANTPQALRDQAVERLNSLETVRRPVLIGAPATAETTTAAATTSTSPSTTPSTTRATTGPASRPASKPASAPAAAPAPKQ